MPDAREDNVVVVVVVEIVDFGGEGVNADVVDNFLPEEDNAVGLVVGDVVVVGEVGVPRDGFAGSFSSCFFGCGSVEVVVVVVTPATGVGMFVLSLTGGLLGAGGNALFASVSAAVALKGEGFVTTGLDLGAASGWSCCFGGGGLVSFSSLGDSCRSSDLVVVVVVVGMGGVSSPGLDVVLFEPMNTNPSPCCS